MVILQLVEHLPGEDSVFNPGYLRFPRNHWGATIPALAGGPCTPLVFKVALLGELERTTGELATFKCFIDILYIVMFI